MPHIDIRLDPTKTENRERLLRPEAISAFTHIDHIADQAIEAIESAVKDHLENPQIPPTYAIMSAVLNAVSKAFEVGHKLAETLDKE